MTTFLKSRSRISRFSSCLGLGVALSIALNPNARAADRVWNNTGTDFNANGSWTTAAPTATDRGRFDTAATMQPNLTSSLIIQGLGFSAAAASGYNLTSSSPSVALTLTNTGTTTTTTAIQVVGASMNIISAPLVLGAAEAAGQTFINAGDLTLNGVISSTNAISGLSYAGAGTYRIGAANTYSGATTQTAGSNLSIGNSSAFSGGTLILSSSSGSLQAGIDLTGNNKIANNVTWGANATLSNSGTNGIEFGGAVNLNNAARTINSAISGGATFDGVISGDNGGGLVIVTTNSSLVTLKGTNIYTGNTTVSGTGSLSVASIGAANANSNVGAGTTINLGNGSNNGGRLIYTGQGENTSKVINFNSTNSGSFITQSGTGNLNFTANTTAIAGAKNLFLQGSTSGTGEISGFISNASGGAAISLIKAGTGTWTLSGVNTYTGGTIIGGSVNADNLNGGTLLVNGGVVGVSSGAGTGSVVLNRANAVLGGSGNISGAVTATIGTINPGPSGTAGTAAAVGTLHTGALTLNPNSNSAFDISAPTTYDQLISSAALTLGGTLNVTIASGLTFNAGDRLTLYTGVSETGTFTGIADNSSVSFSGYSFTADYTATGFDLVAVAVPEPATWFAGLAAFGLLAFHGRKLLAGLVQVRA